MQKVYTIKNTAKQPLAASSPICSSIFEMFGDKWTLRIVSSLRDGELRFKEIQNALSINSATLSGRLKRLEEKGIVTRAEETVDKLSVTYKLTKCGFELVPIYDMIIDFGEKFIKK